MANFNTWMEAHRQGRKNWFHIFPVERLDSPRISEDPDAVMLVDVGGGYGHDLEAFRNAFPESSGRLILEDIPKAVDELPDRRKFLMEAIKYDYCTPQPIIGMCASNSNLDPATDLMCLRSSSILLSVHIPRLCR